MTREQYIGNAIKEMISKGVTCSFIRRKRYSKNSTSYFDSLGLTWTAVPKLVVNYFKDDFDSTFEIFIHEYCHFKQWEEQSDIWKNGIANWFIFELFLQNKFDNFTKDQLKTIQLLELDCDKKVLEDINRYKLKVDTSKYIKESNSYIYSYNVSYDVKNFYTNIDYNDERLLALLPDVPFTVDNIQTPIYEYDTIYKELLAAT